MTSRRPNPFRVYSNEKKFMKIITSQVSENLKLQIPPFFLEKHGIRLSTHVFLKLPNNVVWDMKFMEENEQIWLHKEFIQFYSIQYGHVLIFEYNGNFDFNLVIFDMTASEIIYPFSSPKTDDVSQPSDEPSVEILGVNPGSSSMHKVTEENDEITMDNPVVTDKTKTTAMERAKGLKTNNTSIFVTVGSTYAASMALIPKEFVNQNMVGSDGEVMKEVTLETSSGGHEKKQWKVKCYHRNPRTYIFFVQDNHVKIGDACVFEYIKGVNVVFVHIFTEGL